MVDGIKINISHVPLDLILGIDSVQYEGSFDRVSGEVFEYPISGRYGPYYIKISKSRKIWRGSLHKSHNQRNTGSENNSDDFNIHEIEEEITHLVSLIGVDSSELILENLEYGVNIPYQASKELLRTNIIVFDGYCPSQSKRLKERDYYLEFKRSQWSFKVYSKSHGQILRVEKRVVKSDFFKKWGIRTLGDINQTTLAILRDDLLSSLSKLLIVDDLDPEESRFTQHELDVFRKGINPKYWEQLRSTRHRSQKSRFNKTFRNLLKDKGLNSHSKLISSLVSNKSKELIQCNELTELKSDISATILPIYDESNSSATDIKKCPVTRKSLSGQISMSKFLWENEILDFSMSDPVFFLDLKRRFLNVNRTYESIYEKVYYIAHNIRNRFWNLTYRLEKAELRYEHSLFPLTTMEVDQIKKENYAL